MKNTRSKLMLLASALAFALPLLHPALFAEDASAPAAPALNTPAVNDGPALDSAASPDNSTKPKETAKKKKKKKKKKKAASDTATPATTSDTPALSTTATDTAAK